MRFTYVEPPEITKEIARLANIEKENIIEVTKSELHDFIIELDSSETLRKLKIDFKMLSELATEGRWAHRGMIFTAKSDVKGFHYQNRAFFPAWGIDEDIACGTANLGVAPFWFAKGLGGIGNSQFNMFYAYKGTEIGGVQSIHYDVSTELIEIASFARCGKVLTQSMIGVQRLPLHEEQIAKKSFPKQDRRLRA